MVAREPEANQGGSCAIVWGLRVVNKVVVRLDGVKPGLKTRIINKIKLQ